MKSIVVLILILAFVSARPVFSKEGMLNGVKADGTVYVIKNVFGDLISGYVVEFIHSDADGEGVKLQTDFGPLNVYEFQIEGIYIESEYYRHNHRVFIMPTANPVGENHFIGAFELMFLYGGFGLGDWFSATLGRSVLPTVRSADQISVANVKLSLPYFEFDTTGERLRVAGGFNYASINDANKLYHAYGAATLELSMTSLSAAVFYNASPEPIFQIRFGDNLYAANIYDGGFGLALGMETRIKSSVDIRIIGEIWNNDVTRPNRTLSLLGLRYSGRLCSADFGLAYSTAPFVAPFASFVFTPF